MPASGSRNSCPRRGGGAPPAGATAGNGRRHSSPARRRGGRGGVAPGACGQGARGTAVRGGRAERLRLVPRREPVVAIRRRPRDGGPDGGLRARGGGAVGGAG